MKFEEDPDAGRREEFEKQIKRGWYIGSREFRELLGEKLSARQKLGDNYRGLQRREHREEEAERLLEEGLKYLNISGAKLCEKRNNCLEKQALAWLLNVHTTVTVRWVAERLKMGHPENASHGINRFRKEENAGVKILKKQLHNSLFSVG